MHCTALFRRIINIIIYVYKIQIRSIIICITIILRKLWLRKFYSSSVVIFMFLICYIIYIYILIVKNSSIKCIYILFCYINILLVLKNFWRLSKTLFKDWVSLEVYVEGWTTMFTDNYSVMTFSSWLSNNPYYTSLNHL